MFEVGPQSGELKNHGSDALIYNTFDQYFWYSRTLTKYCQFCEPPSPVPGKTNYSNPLTLQVQCAVKFIF